MFCLNNMDDWRWFLPPSREARKLCEERSLNEKHKYDKGTQCLLREKGDFNKDIGSECRRDIFVVKQSLFLLPGLKEQVIIDTLDLHDRI